jgi:hypothetical protein
MVEYWCFWVAQEVAVVANALQVVMEHQAQLLVAQAEMELLHQFQEHQPPMLEAVVVEGNQGSTSCAPGGTGAGGAGAGTWSVQLRNCWNCQHRRWWRRWRFYRSSGTWLQSAGGSGGSGIVILKIAAGAFIIN